ncbi:MAG: hypothetical protein KC964_02025 [Candidatus Omnitrophica bacterium]|nr:hypothetical protein [Candidatus Omnitrophota bacterium]
MKATKWHYTTEERLHAILTDGYIRQATVGIPVHEKPAAWFSINPDWEQTANKMYKDASGNHYKGTMETTYRFGGLARIGVQDEAAPMTWAVFKRLSGITATDANALEKTAKSKGSNPYHWFASFDPVYDHQWVSIEIYDGRNWADESDLKDVSLGNSAPSSNLCGEGQ